MRIAISIGLISALAVLSIIYTDSTSGPFYDFRYADLKSAAEYSVASRLTRRIPIQMIGCGNPAVIGAELDEDSVAESASNPREKKRCDLGLRLCLYNIFF